ncbi:MULTISPECIES: hypothetical protein [Moorena]|uniref:hypothetical protein n=1 Tax=Moorena TaxID=1155738 RepID=UPI001055D4ED|nr:MULTISPECIES: hypothetical protein [Moorena]NEP37068.1 hypothetical protein [Moorena sp. SIO3B2]NEP68781.1 hypothetical protein [Moorena sp. SIO3A5]NEQ09251.1 hypothetical protein [Moorena sp. SIO4E2]NER86639.1 hypothetical protein [Moorena sp. SIO3A2]
MPTAISGQRSAVSGQRSAVSGQRSAVSGQRSVDVTQIKRMFTCCLDAVAHGGNSQDRNGAFTVVELNSPRVAPLHRLFKSTSSSVAQASTL